MSNRSILDRKKRDKSSATTRIELTPRQFHFATAHVVKVMAECQYGAEPEAITYAAPG